MTMDLIDHMLLHVSDHTAGMEKYAALRQQLRRDFGGPHAPNPALVLLDAAISTHLGMVSNSILTRIGVESEKDYMAYLDRVDEEIFNKIVKITVGNSLGADLLFHAEVLKGAGVTRTMPDDFREMIDECANSM